MSFYRSRSGDLVEAVKFKGGRPEDGSLCFNGEDIDWVVDALNRQRLEMSAFGDGLIVHFRGASYGLVKGDWVIRLREGEVKPCRAERFSEEYEAV